VSNPTYVLTTLGSISLAQSDDPSCSLIGQSRSLLLLALLAQSPRLSGRRDHLAQLLWPDSDVTHARRSLRQTLFRVTKNTEDLVIRDGERLTLNRDVIRVDCWELEGALKRRDYAKVIELYKGPFLAGQERKVSPELEHWIESQNSHIHGGVELAYAKFVEEALHAGATEKAVRHARDFAAVNPLDEAAQILLVRALRADGDEVAALGAFQAYRTLLDKEVGDSPAAEWEERMDRVRKEVFAPIVEYVVPAVDRRAIVGPEERVAIPARGSRSILLSVAALIITAIGIGASISLRPRPTGPLADISGHVLVSIAQGTDTTLTVLKEDGSRADSKRVPEIKSTAVRAPNGRWFAFAQAASDGWNLAVRDVEADSVVRLTSAPEDEFPLAWSPDSRFIVFARRRVHREGRSYVHDVQVLDIVARSSRRLARGLTSVRLPSASWSPDGTQIVFTADNRGGSDIFIVDFDGDRLRNITRNAVEDFDPVWSPDRERVAFVSRRGEGVDVLTMRPDGTDLQRVARVDSNARSPRWFSAGVILYLVASGDGGDVWAVDAFNGQTRQLTFRGDIVDLSSILHDESEHPWIQQIAIGPRHTLASPGQHFSLDVVAVDALGDTVPVTNLPVRWLVNDRSVATFLEPGWLHAADSGRFLVTASLAGWRSDTVYMTSLPIVEDPAEAVVQENWTSELNERVWRPFGEPRPKTAAVGSPTGGVFLNNGDAFFESGVVLRQPVRLDSGVTVEAGGRMPFTGQLHQTYGISIRRELPQDSHELGSNGFIVDFRIQGPSADEPAKAWIATTDHRESIPLPEAPGAWRRYALQLRPDGLVEIVIDGQIHWRSTFRAFTEGNVPDPAYVTLGYRSFQTGIAHGPVSVYERPKYRVSYLTETDRDSTLVAQSR
jgi:DNA-binding SARP family transcriptional activator